MTVEIPVEKHEEERFLKWADHYGMEAKRIKNSLYIIVIFTDPVDLYWLGANMCGTMSRSSLTKSRF